MFLAASVDFSTAFIAKEPGDLQRGHGLGTSRCQHHCSIALHLRFSQLAQSRFAAEHRDGGSADPANPCCGSQTRLLSLHLLFKLVNIKTTRATSVVIITTNSEVNPLCVLSLSPSYTALSGFMQKINSVCGKAGELQPG